MSRLNKVNKDLYNQSGRLAPDEIARERMKQTRVSGGAKRDRNVDDTPRSVPARSRSRPRATRKGSD